MNSIFEQLSTPGKEYICPSAMIIKDGKILMGKRHYRPDFIVWTFPGGRCEEGETVEETLRREIKEETGLDDLEIKEFACDIPGYTEDDIVPIYLCSTNQEAKLMEPDKFSEWKWFTFDEYKQGIFESPVPSSRQTVIEYLSKIF